FYKGGLNHYAVLFKNGKVIKEGTGLNFWYRTGLSNLSLVPVQSQDAPFIFTETTSDFQELAVQGTVTYRVSDPAKLARVLNLTVKPGSGKYVTDDADKIVSRVVMSVQAHARSRIVAFPLRDALTRVHEVADEVLQAVRGETDLLNMGISIEGLYFTNLSAKPEMQKALEADYRESLQREADKAIYARRVAAQAEEHKLVEQGLATDIELENRRVELVDTKARNQLAEAEVAGKAEELKLKPYAELPPQALVGMALKEWAANAGNIDNLSITPDVLTGLVGWLANGKAPQVRT
ncbi:MAG TPA: SPFH domain-containing protein, partial [Rhizobiales bacterium]|nr:SPFH domain-containing protein [Hyphomicrobiales bacterium]